MRPARGRLGPLAATWIALLTVAMAGARETPWVVRDTEFADGDWAMTVESHGEELATALAHQEPNGGRPGAFRLMMHKLPAPSELAVLHVYVAPGGTYDPAAEGAIGGIDYGEDRIKNAPLFIGPPVTASFVVMQAGRTYFYEDDGGFTAFNNIFWRRVRLRCLHAADFRGDSPAPQPDFSAGGAPIQFGIFRAGRNDATFEGETIRATHGLDNWRVVVHPAADPTCRDVPACVADADCDDFDPCTRDACVGAVCVNTGDARGVAREVKRLRDFLGGRPCDMERLPRRLRAKAKRGLARVRRSLRAAGGATTPTEIARLNARLDKVRTLLSDARLTSACAQNLAAFVDDLRACVALLPG